MADDEQFSLCWNNFNTNLSAGFHESLIRGDLVDVTLAAEGQLVKAHRLILSVCSPYFRKMFTQMPANQHAFIFLKDVSHSALKDLIQFMYCGEVNVKQDALPAFISTAEALQIKGLTETGESAPAQQSPAKDSTSHHHLPSSGAATSTASSPRAKPQRTRIQSYKLDSDDGGSSDHEKVVQIQPSPATLVAAGSSSGATTLVTHAVSAAPQQVQIMTTVPTVSQATKRTITQRASITPQTTQVLKRAKMSDPLEASEPAQIQTVQIVKQITQTSAQSTATAVTASSEPEYVEMPIETINPKAEPEYADDPSEVEAIDTEHEQEQALTEHEQHEHDQDADDSANYVEDETYGDMSKYDESYFTEGDDAKAGASGFGSESYTEGGAADQAAQAMRPHESMEPSVWYTMALHMVEKRRGNLNLLFQNYKYSEVRDSTKKIATSTKLEMVSSNKTTTWRCSRRDKGCLARVITRGHNQLKLGIHQHNHLPVAASRGKRTKPLVRLPKLGDIKREPVDIEDNFQ